MIEEVRLCVEARTGFFGKYMSVPSTLQPEVNSFRERITALGEVSPNAAEFEQYFLNSGLSDVFNSLVTRCTPQPYQMTQEDKAYARQVAREIFTEDRKRILKEAGEDLVDSMEMKVESDLRTQRIKQMSEAGVLDDYTRSSNVIEDVGILARWLGKKKK